MRDVTSNNFGLLIAFVLPGFVALWGIRELIPTVDQWLAGSPEQSATVGGFLYVTLASVGAGLFVSAIRWLVIDGIHHETGIPRPSWNFSRLDGRVTAFDLLNEGHYRHYQFYGNTLVAMTIAYLVHRWQTGFIVTAIDAMYAAVAVVLFLGSRDNLRKYYARVERVLGREAPRPPQPGS